MSKPYIDFAAIKAAVSITQVLEHYGILPNLRPSGADALRGPCPVHKGGDQKQFSVSKSKNCWHCFAGECGLGGNTLDLVAALEETDVHQAALLLNDWFDLGLQPPEKHHTHSRRPARPKPEEVDEENSDRVGDEPSPRPVTAEPVSNKPLGFALKKLDSEHPYLSERGLEAGTQGADGTRHERRGAPDPSRGGVARRQCRAAAGL